MPQDYVTRQDVKARRSLSEADTRDDAIIDAIIPAVCRAVDEYCNVRPGAFLAESQTRYYTATDSHCLVVDNLVSVGTSGLETDNGYNLTYSATWSTAAYDLYPHNATLDGRPYWQIHARSSASNTFPVGRERGVKITGTFGWSAEPPYQIREAVLLIVNRFIERRNSPFGVVGNAEVGTFRISPIDPDVRELLEPFRERIAY